ncbi:MAG: DNA mismatch repair endonuclease MutL [Deltaproteobacteria bacterium]|nr:DNA mismatch repair endonuclease MutL [Deltaproteobacteria bacterium]
MEGQDEAGPGPVNDKAAAGATDDAAAPRIERLPEHVANQIAAGEVVERPASVVKELLENALDAEARSIEVEVEGGGVSLIRVTDDGLGMGPKDALRCLERHATSKIRSASDLETVTTLGFRGEAVPSIASVSRFTLATTQRGASEGTRIVVEGGALLETRSTGGIQGTEIEVRDLFFNQPARRKFLKQPSTEMGHIAEAVSRLAIAHAKVAFKLRHGARVLLDAPPETPLDPLGRLSRILGPNVAEHLWPIAPVASVAPLGVDGEIGAREVRVSGFLSAPSLSERTARGLYVFLNGRFIRDRTVQHAVQDAYRTLLERGRYPVVVIALDLHPSMFDVNVHPQKTEVRFARSQDVHRAVARALGQTLVREPWRGRQVFPMGAGPASSAGVLGEAALHADEGLEDGSGRRADEVRLGLCAKDADPESSASGAGRGTSAVHSAGRGPSWDLGDSPDDRGFGSWHRPSGASSLRGGFGGLGGFSGSSGTSGASGTSGSRNAGGGARVGTRTVGPPSPALRLFEVGSGVKASASSVARFSDLEPVGQVLSTYLVCLDSGGLVVIDQHAAHERIAFEKLRSQHRGRAIDVQPLLVPLPIELDPVRASAAVDHREKLASMGLDIEPFGGSTWMVKSSPALLQRADLEQVVKDLLDDLREVPATTALDEVVEGLLARAACHSVVKAGDRLGREEIRALLEAMDRVDFGGHCPHGRPVFVRWTERDFAKLFHRA